MAPSNNYNSSISSHLAKRSDNFLLLRILAAIAVIYGHSFHIAPTEGKQDIFIRYGFPMYSGDMAVAIFFVTSGFMVSGSYINRADLIQFTKARLLRIIPAFALVLAIWALFIGPFITSLPVKDYFSSPETFSYITRNLKFSSEMSWALPGVFNSNPHSTVNGSIWTLPAEMRMYLLCAALGCFGLLSNRLLGTTFLALLTALAIFHPQALPLHSDWVRLGGFFTLGILAQLYKDKIKIQHTTMFMLALIAYISMKTSSKLWIFSICLAYFCFWFAYLTPTWKNLEKWGDPSYGIYLWGWPLQQILVNFLPKISALQNFIIASALAVLIGYLSWWLLEKRVLKLKDWRFTPEKFFHPNKETS